MATTPKSVDAVVIFPGALPDAALWFDGRFIGDIGQFRGGIAVDPGSHRLEIRHDDYFSQYVELELGAGERRTVTVDLAPKLP